ncbi:MAG: hypothetical protein WBC69_12220 [Geitlerinemataceae cyanobacterium]
MIPPEPTPEPEPSILPEGIDRSQLRPLPTANQSSSHPHPQPHHRHPNGFYPVR